MQSSQLGLSQEILMINQEESQRFLEFTTVRSAYRELHPTEFAVTKCMDGRIDFTRITGIPAGIITAFRSIGGIHNLEWDNFRRDLENWQNHARTKKRSAVLIVTYHWSRSASWLGCKGFNYDLQAAIDQMSEFRRQVESRYRGEIWPVVVGIETDTNSFIIHSSKGEVFDLGLVFPGVSISFLEEKTQSMFPEISERAIKDLASLFSGNVHCINRETSPEPQGHGERILAVGEYLEWLPFGFALKIGSHDPFLNRSVVTATSIIQDNLLSGRISDSGVLLVSTPYWQPDQKSVAMEQSRSLFQIVSNSIMENHPNMWEFFNPLVGVMNLDTNRFEEV